jgi:hypothetical protein
VKVIALLSCGTLRTIVGTIVRTIVKILFRDAPGLVSLLMLAHTDRIII